MADTHRQAAIGQSSTLMLGCFTCHFTATSQLPREVNKFLLAYIIMFKRVNLRQYFIGLHEYCCNVSNSSSYLRDNSTESQ